MTVKMVEIWYKNGIKWYDQVCSDNRYGYHGLVNSWWNYIMLGLGKHTESVKLPELLGCVAGVCAAVRSWVLVATCCCLGMAKLMVGLTI